MASKANAFDMVMLKIGYTEYVMPREAALAFINACAGADIYKHETLWIGNDRRPLAKLLEPNDMPSLQLIGPVQFHQGLENHRMEQEKKRAESTD